jgi:hypothetical protein
MSWADIDWVSATGKQHLNFQISNDAVKTLVLSALNTVKDSSGKMVFTIPAQQSNLKEQLKDEKFQPLIDIVQELAALDLGQPFLFAVTSNAGTAKSLVKSEDVKIELLAADKNAFILSLATTISGIDVSIPKLSVCDGNACTKKSLRADINGISIKQVNGTFLKVSAKLKISIINGIASASLYDLVTNLGKKSGPQIYVNFASLKVPPVSIIINDQATTMDTSSLRDMILEYKTDIAHKIIEQAANIMKNDVQKILNGFLKGKNFSTNVAGNYQKPYEPIEIPKPVYVAERDNTYVYRPPMPNLKPKPIVPEPSVQEKIISELMRMVDSADFGLSVSKIAAANNRLDLAFNPNLAINGQSMIVPIYIGNGAYDRELAPLIYSSAPLDYNVAVGISESLINAIVSTPEDSLDMMNYILSRTGDFRGIQVNYPGVKFHILNKKIYIVANLHITLDNVPTKGALETFKKWLAGISEMFHETHGHLKFPLEIALTPSVVSQNGEKFLKLIPTSPVTGANLNNTFGYYSNINKATGALKDKVVDEIKTAVGKSFSKEILIPLKEMTNLSEVNVDPQALGVEPSGHLVIYGKIKSINLNKILGKK